MSKSAYEQLAQAISGNVSTLTETERNGLKALLDDFNNQPQLSYPSFTVTINYDQTVKQLIKAGKYDRVNSDITNKNFPLNKKGEEQTEIFIVSISHQMSDLEVTQFLDSLGLRDANIKEGLSLGAQYPNLQRNNPIVARGTSWRDPVGRLMVPCLRSYDSSRRLYLISLVGGWDSLWRFAAVRK